MSIKAKCVRRPNGGDQLDNSKVNLDKYFIGFFKKNFENESTLKN